MEKQLTARKRQALEMRSRIQNVALDLFDRDGFENVSVEQIAQAAGCSVGNIYHYFKSKDELIIHVTSSVDAQYEVLEQNYLADTGISARSKLLDFVGRSLDISCKDPSLYRSFIHGLKYPEQAILRDNDSRVYFRVLRELTAACQQEGSVSPPARPGGAGGRSGGAPPRHAVRVAHLRTGLRSGAPRPPDGRCPAGRLASAGKLNPRWTANAVLPSVCGLFLCDMPTFRKCPKRR